MSLPDPLVRLIEELQRLPGRKLVGIARRKRLLDRRLDGLGDAASGPRRRGGEQWQVVGGPARFELTTSAFGE